MRPGRFVGGLIVVLVGILLLAASLGWVDWGFLLSLLQLWPVILILVGVSLLVGRAHPTLTAIIMGLVLVATVAAAWGLWGTSWAAPEERAVIGLPATGITRGQANLTVAATQLTLGGGDIDTVTSGTYRMRMDMQVDQSATGGGYQLTMEPKGTSWWAPGLGGGSRDDGIRLTLKSGIPWDITVNGGAASLELDLSNVTLQRLSINTGASSANITVGQYVAPDARLQLTGGVGSYRIRFPRSLALTVRGETGLTSLDTEGFQAQGEGVFVHDGGGQHLEVDLRTGVSSVKLELY